MCLTHGSSTCLDPIIRFNDGLARVFWHGLCFSVVLLVSLSGCAPVVVENLNLDQDQRSIAIPANIDALPLRTAILIQPEFLEVQQKYYEGAKEAEFDDRFILTNKFTYEYFTDAFNSIFQKTKPVESLDSANASDFDAAIEITRSDFAIWKGPRNWSGDPFAVAKEPPHARLELEIIFYDGRSQPIATWLWQGDYISYGRRNLFQAVNRSLSILLDRASAQFLTEFAYTDATARWLSKKGIHYSLPSHTTYKGPHRKKIINKLSISINPEVNWVSNCIHEQLASNAYAGIADRDELAKYYYPWISKHATSETISSNLRKIAGSPLHNEMLRKKGFI